MTLQSFVREIRRDMSAGTGTEALIGRIEARMNATIEEHRSLGERASTEGDTASSSALIERVNGDMSALSELAAIKAELKAEIRAWQQHEQRQADANRSRINGGGAPAGGEWRSMFPSMSEFKAQATSTDPGGGYLVPSQDAAQFYDRLRPSNVVLQANPQIVSFESDSIKLPKLGTSTTVVNAGEGGTITESDAAFQQLQIDARKYAVRTIGSNEWFADAAYPARRILEEDHRKQIGAALDRDFLQGAGGTKILGMRNWPGVTVTTLGAGAGLAPTLDNIADAIDRLERDNAKATAIFMHPRTWATFRKNKDLQDRYQLQPDPTADSRRQLFGVPVFVSSQVSITETVGASNDCSYIVVADMSRVVVGRRQEIIVLYDPYTKSGTGQVVINTWSRWGFGVLDVEAIEVIAGVRP